jgi:hypothetical protein
MMFCLGPRLVNGSRRELFGAIFVFKKLSCTNHSITAREIGGGGRKPMVMD